MKMTYICVKIFIFTFMLQDVNDETPTFRSKSYVGEISENSPRATPILFLGGNVLPEVFDHDSGTNGTFQLFLEGDQGIFEVISFIENVEVLLIQILKVKNCQFQKHFIIVQLFLSYR